MQYLFLLLVLVGCASPKAEASINNPQAVQPIDYEPSDTYKKFSRKNLGAYKTLPSGKIVAYTNEFGVELPNWNEKALTEQEIYKFLYDTEWGFIQLASEITDKKKEFVSTQALYDGIKKFIPNNDTVDHQSFLSILNFIYPESWILLYEPYSPYEITDDQNNPFPLLTLEQLENIFGKTIKQKEISHFNRYLSIMLFGDFLGNPSNVFSAFPPISSELIPDSISEERAAEQPWLTNNYSFEIIKSTNIISP